MADEFKKGDRVEFHYGVGTVIGVQEDGKVLVLPDTEPWIVAPGGLKLLDAPEVTVVEEVQELMNTLVSAGQDNPRLLSRQVSTLLAETKGRLTRGERLQAAAMLLVACWVPPERTEEELEG